MKAATFFLAVILTVSAATAENPNRGDFNGDGSEAWSIGDAIYLFQYLFEGGPPPPDPEIDSLDVDCYHLLTISDANISFQCALICDFPPVCSEIYPPLYPDVDPQSEMSYSNRIRPNTPSAKLRISLVKPSFYESYALVFHIRVDGQIPTIDSVIYPASDYAPFACGYFTEDETGGLALGAIETWNMKILPGARGPHIADVYVSVPQMPTEQPVTVEWTTMDPIQAPTTPDGSVYTMLTESYGYEGVPVLHPTCCITPGDVNDDGVVDVADVVYMIGYAFLYGPPPPCPSQADANCDYGMNVGDAVYLIGYIFKGGPPPCCM